MADFIDTLLDTFGGFLEPKQLKVLKQDVHNIREAHAEFTTISVELRRQKIRNALESLAISIEEKITGYTAAAQQRHRKLSKRIDFLQGRKDHYELLLKGEPQSTKLLEIISEATTQEEKVNRLYKLPLTEEKIEAYLVTHGVYTELQRSLADLHNTLPVAVIQEQLGIDSPKAKSAKTKKLNGTTREDILKRMQGLPPEQQLLERWEIEILVGISTTTFYDYRKQGDMPEPERFAGKARKPVFRLDEVMAKYAGARQKRKAR